MNPEQLLDQRAIVELTVRYCWALDERNFEALRSIFSPDCTALYGRLHLVGVEQVMARCQRALEILDASQHLVSTHQVNIVGDSATCRCYFHAQHVRHGAASELDPSPNFVVAGRYTDDLVRTGQGWRIRRRVLADMWTHGNVRVVSPLAANQPAHGH